jgi:hypothetical protein
MSKTLPVSLLNDPVLMVGTDWALCRNVNIYRVVVTTKVSEKMHHSRSTDRLELQKARSRADGLPD